MTIVIAIMVSEQTERTTQPEEMQKLEKIFDVVVDKKDLEGKVKVAGKVVPRKPFHPVLSGLKFVGSVDEQELRIKVFDMSLGMELVVESEIQKDIEVVVPAKILIELLSKLPEGNLGIDQIENGIKITSQVGEHEIVCYKEEYPELPEIEGESIEVSADVLKKGIRQSSICVSDDETKPVLTGVYVNIGDFIEFAATDGHKLAVISNSHESSPEQLLESVVPFSALIKIEDLLKMNPKEDKVEIQLQGNQIKFSVGEGRITSRAIDERFPAYKSLIPSSFERVSVCSAKELASAVERAAIFSSRKNTVVALNIEDEGKIWIHGEAEVGQNTEAIASEYSGGGIKICFNANYLSRVLHMIESDNVKLSMNSPTGPMILTPNEDEQKQLYLLMPIKGE